MAAGQGFKTFTTGEVLTAGDVNGYLMQGVLVFASAAARDAAITSPQEGQFAFTKDTNGLWYYDGAAWVASGATGDIEGVTAGVGISGGGTSGTVTITNSMATAIDAKGDLVVGTAADTFSRLAVGATAGQVLTVDSTEATGMKWATPSGSAITWTNLVNGTAVSGSSTSFTGLSGYDYLFVNFRYLQSNQGSDQFNLNVNSDTGANYFDFHSRLIAQSSYSADYMTADAELGATKVYLSTQSNSASNGGNAGYLQIAGCNSTSHKTFHKAIGQYKSSTANDQRSIYGGGFIKNTSVISSIQVSCLYGSFTAGSVYIYGGN